MAGSARSGRSSSVRVRARVWATSARRSSSSWSSRRCSRTSTACSPCAASSWHPPRPSGAGRLPRPSAPAGAARRRRTHLPGSTRIPGRLLAHPRRPIKGLLLAAGPRWTRRRLRALPAHPLRIHRGGDGSRGRGTERRLGDGGARAGRGARVPRRSGVTNPSGEPQPFTRSGYRRGGHSKPRGFVVHLLSVFSLRNRALIASLSPSSSASSGGVALTSLKQELFLARAAQRLHHHHLPGASPDVVNTDVDPDRGGDPERRRPGEHERDLERELLADLGLVRLRRPTSPPQSRRCKLAVNRIKSQLPADVEPQIITFSLTDLPVVQLADERPLDK